MPSLAKINALWRVPLILLVTAFLASVSVFLSLFDGRGRWQHQCARLWSRFILLVSRVQVKVRGLEKLDPNRGYIFAANHLSMFDHWAFLAAIPLQFRFVAKASLFRIPFLGWHLKRSGNIAVDRRNPHQAVRSYRSAARKIAEGQSFVIYPEGMRTWGETASFKRGAFLLARHAEAAIVPVTIIDAHRRLARGSLVIYPGQMEMIIHRPIEFEEYRDLDLETLAATVRQCIVEGHRRPDRYVP